MDELDFCQNPQKPFLEPFHFTFWLFLARQDFFFKLTFFKFVSLWLSIFIQKLEKTDDLILRSCVWYGRTDGQSQIHRSLLLMQVSNNYQLKIMVHARNRNVPRCQNQSDIQFQINSYINISNSTESADLYFKPLTYISIKFFSFKRIPEQKYTYVIILKDLPTPEEVLLFERIAHISSSKFSNP